MLTFTFHRDPDRTWRVLVNGRELSRGHASKKLARASVGVAKGPSR